MSAWATALQESSKEAIFEECIKQRERADAFEEEAMEQARLLGKSGSREAALLTKIDNLRRRLEAIRAEAEPFTERSIEMSRIWRLADRGLIDLGEK